MVRSRLAVIAAFFAVAKLIDYTADAGLECYNAAKAAHTSNPRIFTVVETLKDNYYCKEAIADAVRVVGIGWASLSAAESQLMHFIIGILLMFRLTSNKNITCTTMREVLGGLFQVIHAWVPYFPKRAANGQFKKAK